ncbi:hypothetical protein C8A05DRAFT_41309 [Staphylotrichum tortipilum]|uniref:Autophagy protein n=1 Tax=Staphylotrichum tortipilum TaxID=2831512 RepID=A0AAN6RWQ8_9PEZI|nr:hypothetical protein C8A05DRAFT_41309 [Staphylotrichum longicolle]
MGWFGSWFGSDKESDPLGHLDPKLREFLERESPVKFTPPPLPPPPAPQQQTQQQQQQSQSQSQQPSDPSTSIVPPQSLFPDGRYAHLWKTYRPLAAIEAETKSDNEKLSDIIDAYKERKAQIGRAALENCAEEQFEWSDCMRSGSMRARMTLCRDEVRRFERCYGGQARLLKALGYLSVHGRRPDLDEEVQMRADELYHQMLAREAEMKRAKEEGRPVPAFKPLLDAEAVAKTTTTAPMAGRSRAPEPSPALLAVWKERLEKLPPEEREAEEHALRAEFKAGAEVGGQLEGLWKKQDDERKARESEGKETAFDKFRRLAKLWGGSS